MEFWIYFFREIQMTIKQLDQSLAMFRKQCIQKTGVDPGKCIIQMQNKIRKQF